MIEADDERMSAAIASIASSRLTRPDGAPIRAVVVDDDRSLVSLLRMALRYEGWEVTTASDGEGALKTIREVRPDVIVLDVMLPGIEGTTLLHRLRQEGMTTPTLLLTAKDTVADRVAGLTVGGDDYVTKPFSVEELVARLRALYRRSLLSGVAAAELRVGDLVLDEESHDVARGGVAIELSPTEFELLRFLMRNPRRVIPKREILRHVWEYDFAGTSTVVELYISYLRKKIDAIGAPMIHTVRGVGYALKPAE